MIRRYIVAAIFTAVGVYLCGRSLSEFPGPGLGVVFALYGAIQFVIALVESTAGEGKKGNDQERID